MKHPYFGHASDCSLHNAPALPVGTCDCGVLGLVDLYKFHAKLEEDFKLLPPGLQRSQIEYILVLLAALRKISDEGLNDNDGSHWGCQNNGDYYSAGIQAGAFAAGEIARKAIAGLCVWPVRAEDKPNG